jgi:plasmid maintenance system antidote protein VapI
MAIHFGNILSNYCYDQNLKANHLAQFLGLTTDAVYKIFKNSDTKIGSVLKISQELDHDFFKYYQEQLKFNIYQHASDLEKENQQLKTELQTLRIETEIYKKLLKIEDPGK